MLLTQLTDKPPQAFELDDLWQQFHDPDVERHFRNHAVPLHQAALRRLVLFAALAWIAFFSHDLVVCGGFSARLIAPVLTRLACGGGCLYLWWRLRRTGLKAATVALFATIAGVLCLGGMPVMLWLLPQESLLLSSLQVMATIGFYLLLPNRLYHAVIISVTATLLFVGAAHAAQVYDHRNSVVLASVLLSVNVFGFIMGQDFQRSWRREFRTYVELQRRTIRDHLTGCLTRRFLFEALMPAEIERARRYRTWLSVVICDIDHFKAINDTYGHQAGDAVLRHCAQLLIAGSRYSIDAVSRLGGEEFLLLLPNTDVAGAAVIAERLRQALAAAVPDPREPEIRATASFGVCGVDFAVGDASERDLVSSADHLLYQAKNTGRNRVCAGGLRDPGPGGVRGAVARRA